MKRSRSATISCVMVSLSVPAAAPAEGQTPASNQSVAIEGAALPGATPAPPSAESIPSRSLRRKPSALTETLDNDRGVPWYRTSLGALGVVLGVVAVVFLLLRRWAPSVRAPDSGVLKVFGRAGLTPKHSLAAVQFGRRFVLVGISPDRVQALSEVSDPEEAAELAGRVGARWPAGRDDFDSLLTRETAAYEPPAQEAAAVRGEATDRSSAPLRDLLRKLKALQSK